MTSRDGRTWSEPRSLANIAQGHYQVTASDGARVATAFNYHPRQGGLNARTNLYYLEIARRRKNSGKPPRARRSPRR